MDYVHEKAHKEDGQDVPRLVPLFSHKALGSRDDGGWPVEAADDASGSREDGVLLRSFVAAGPPGSGPSLLDTEAL